mgnify:CR=1 FL=1
MATNLVSQCTYRCVVLPDVQWWEVAWPPISCLNAPTGAWCSLTAQARQEWSDPNGVSMHLQVRGAP